jgi:hypothetical protein
MAADQAQKKTKQSFHLLLLLDSGGFGYSLPHLLGVPQALLREVAVFGAPAMFSASLGDFHEDE